MPKRLLVPLAFVLVAGLLWRLDDVPQQRVPADVVPMVDVVEREDGPVDRDASPVGIEPVSAAPNATAARTAIAAELPEIDDRPPGMASVVVRVVDAAGRPIERAAVTASGPARPHYVGGRRDRGIPRTEGDGTARFLTLPETTVDVVAITADGQRASVRDAKTPAAERDRELVVVVPTDRERTETVVLVRSATSREPLVGATVTVNPALSLGGDGVTSLPTDERGRAVVHLLPGDGLRVEADGFTTEFQPPTSRRRTQRVFVLMREQALLEGRIRIADGARPSGRLSVRVERDLLGRPESLGTGRVGSDGHWSIGAIDVPEDTDTLRDLRVVYTLGRWSKTVPLASTLAPGETLKLVQSFDGDAARRDANGLYDGWMKGPEPRDWRQDAWNAEMAKTRALGSWRDQSR